MPAGGQPLVGSAEGTLHTPWATRVLTRYFCFPHWNGLLATMLKQSPPLGLRRVRALA